MAEEKKQNQEEEVEVPAKFKNLVDKIFNLSALDLAELVKVLEKKFGISSQPQMVAGIAAAPTVGVEAPVEEKTSFNVELTEVGANKINVIKVIREVTQKGLKESKDLVDAAPKIVKEEVTKEEAEAIKKKLEEAGAKAVLK